MKLFVFKLFKDHSVLDKIRQGIPELDISISDDITRGTISDLSLSIMETNAKLFYELHEESQVDVMLTKLITYNFEVIYRKVPFSKTITKKTKKYIGEKDMTCNSCGLVSSKAIYDELESKKTITNYMSDRVILKYKV